MPVRFSSLRKWDLFYGILLLYALFLSACNDEPHSPPIPATPPTSAPRFIQLTLTYAWEKKAWIDDITTQFNSAHYTINDGQIISVEAIAMNSKNIIDEVLAGTRQPHLISPASSAFIELGNAQSLKTNREMVIYTQKLVLSPIVIALRKPMAEVLGWGRKNLGWPELLTITQNSKSWALKYPQWGRFKLGHPHPEYSNSGLLSLFTQIYAGADKLTNLTVADLDKPEIEDYLKNSQQIVFHYGASSQFFLEQLQNDKPHNLSAALLYEHQVIQSYQKYNVLSHPLVAIYPKEGTLFADHPIGIVGRDWVTPAHYEAARIFIDYLLDKSQQEKALHYGFRPTNVSVPLSAPIDTAHGVDPSEPKISLEMPSFPVIEASLKMWSQQKKPANIILILDVSGGMRGEKIEHAHSVALQLFEVLKEADYLSLLSFNHRLNWVAKNVSVKTQRQWLERKIKYQFAGGGTALYEAISEAYTFLTQNAPFDKIPIIVVLSEGEDSHSQLTFKDLLSQVQFDSETTPIRIFTVGYGSAVEKKRLREIAEASQGQFYDGTTDEVRKKFKEEIAKFF
jgi:Ca-activated chloride channel family protein